MRQSCRRKGHGSLEFSREVFWIELLCVGLEGQEVSGQLDGCGRLSFLVSSYFLAGRIIKRFVLPDGGAGHLIQTHGVSLYCITLKRWGTLWPWFGFYHRRID